MFDALNNGCVLGGGEGCLGGDCDVGGDVRLSGVCGGDECLGVWDVSLHTRAHPNYGTLRLLWAPKGLIHLYVHNSISETRQKSVCKETRHHLCSRNNAIATGRQIQQLLAFITAPGNASPYYYIVVFHPPFYQFN